MVKTNLGDHSFLLGFDKAGSLFYSVKNFRSDIFIARVDFNTGEILSEPVKISKVKGDRNAKPIWSPDGRYVMYSSWGTGNENVLGTRQDIMIYDTMTKETRKLDTELFLTAGIHWSLPRWSPNTESILIQGRSGADKLQGLFLIDLDSEKRTPLLVKELEPRNLSTPVGFLPQFSKDGKNIFYLSGDRKSLIKRSLASKEELIIIEGDDEIYQYRLSPDESRIIFGYYFRDREVIYAVPSEGGSLTTIVKVEEENVRPYLANWISEDHLLYQTGNYGSEDSNKIWRTQLDSGIQELVIKGEGLLPRAKFRELNVHPDGQQILIGAEIGQGQEIWKMENLLINDN
jgi:Tol biopolymer transport system component